MANLDICSVWYNNWDLHAGDHSEHSHHSRAGMYTYAGVLQYTVPSYVS